MKNVFTYISSRSEQGEKKNQQTWRKGNWNGQVWRPGRNEIWVLDEEKEKEIGKKFEEMLGEDLYNLIKGTYTHTQETKLATS